METIKMHIMTDTIKNEQGKFYKEFVYIIFAAGLLSFSAYRGMSQVFLLLYVVTCLLGLGFSVYTPLYIRIAVLYATDLVEFSNLFTLVIWGITVGPIVISYILSRKGRIEQSKFYLFALSAAVFFVSCTFGVGSRYTSLIMQCLYVLAFLCAASLRKPEQLRMAMYSFILSGAFVCVVVFMELVGGTAHWIGYGYRLTYNRNERDLANAMTVPAYYFSYKLLGNTEQDRLFQNETNKHTKILDVLFLLPFAVLLFLSYSRGNYLALAVPVIFILLKGNKENKIRIVIALIALVVGMYFLIGQLNIRIRYDEMLNYHGSANARFEIWSYYIRRLFDYPIRFLFGFGPGDLKRIAEGTSYANYYAHSAIFDYLFAFGFMGFVVVLYMLIKSFTVPKTNNDVFLMGFSLLTLILFLPYGASASFEFHFMLGLAAGSTIRYPLEGE